MLPSLGLDESELLKEHIKIGNTDFQIRKLLPMEQFRVLEEIRVALGMSMRPEDLAAIGGVDTFGGIVSIVLKLAPAAVESVRQQLFEQVLFRNDSAQTWLELSRREPTAFEHLEAIHIYELLIRAVAVNFFGSWSVIRSRIPATSPTTPPPPTEI